MLCGFWFFPVFGSRWCAVLVPGTDTHLSTSKTGWPKCVTTAMLSSGKKVNLISSCFAVMGEFCERTEQGQSLIWLHFGCSLKKTAVMLLFYTKPNQRMAPTALPQPFHADWMSVGGSMSVACSNSSPRTHRASRPLSAVFQSLQPPSLWKNKKCSSSLSQVDYNPIYFHHLKIAIFFLA